LFNNLQATGLVAAQNLGLVMPVEAIALFKRVEFGQIDGRLVTSAFRTCCTCCFGSDAYFRVSPEQFL